MSQSEFLSDLLGSGATGYARSAAQRLLEQRPETAERFGPGAFRGWTRHLSQRTRELAAAVLVDEPDLFAAEAGWAAVSFAAREVPLDDLRASFECLNEALLEELPEQVRELPGPFFETALARLAETSAPPEPGLGDDTPENRRALAYLEAALAGRRRAAIDLMLDDGTDLATAYSVLQIAQDHVGELWHAGRVSIAQEHVVTATTEATMSLLAHRAGAETDPSRTVVVAPAPGNAHDLGAKALAHWLEAGGWNSIYLGGELPANDLALAVQAFDARLLALSVALSTQLGGTLRTVRAARKARPGLKVVLGGRLFAAAPRLWEKLGGDGSATSLAAALDECERLLGD